jgi:O-acetyl-ADP-ribose deacetylase (regulator of RNase III)
MNTLKPFGPRRSNVLQLSVGDLNSDVAEKLAHHFHGVDAVEVVQGNLLDVDCDAIVSPANSFGDMSGGIDKVIDDFHEGEAQRRVMAAIREQYLGELPVGVALVVELPSQRFPFVVAAPTMRFPGNVQGSLNSYFAMRAALVAVLNHNASGRNPIRSMAVPGLCTGVGAMDYDESASQMRIAFDNVIGGKWSEIVHMSQAPYAFRGIGGNVRLS